MNKIIKVVNLGKISFENAWKIQCNIAKRHFDGLNTKSDINHDTILLLEHNPVYTVGIRRLDYEQDEEKLRKLGADFVKTNRGGLITFHGPGQLIAYPIINLGNYKKSVRWYVCQLEQSVIGMCKEFGIRAKTSPDTGVWVEDDKIAAIGIHGSRFVTTHGLAINCDVDLNWFKHIIPCGIKDKGVTSLSEQLKKQVTIDETIPVFLNSFQQQFKCQFEFQHDLKIQQKS